MQINMTEDLFSGPFVTEFSVATISNLTLATDGRLKCMIIFTSAVQCVCLEHCHI